jgi:MoxR-like ATPase
VRLVRAKRDTAGLALGAGSRGAIALIRGARAVALMGARNYVTPDDVKKVALPCLRHRVALAPDALLEGRKANDLLTSIIESTAAPRM